MLHRLATNALRALSAGTPDQLSGHIRSALARGLPEFHPAPLAHNGSVVIVGSGPTVTEHLDEIRAERAAGHLVCAIKGAHDWLCDNGIEPDAFVSCEPRVRPLRHVSERCTYLLASRCPPELFDQLAAARVVLWHSLSSRSDCAPKNGASMKWDDLDLTDECETFRDRVFDGRSFGVGGGSTSGLRAISLFFFMGFRDITLYGFDSCLAADKYTKRFTGEGVGEGQIVDVIVNGRRFWANGAMADQAAHFQDIVNALPGLRLRAVGDGIIPEILRARAERRYAA